MLPARIGCLPQYLIAALAPGAGGCVADNYWGVVDAVQDMTWIRDAASRNWPLSADEKTITVGANVNSSTKATGVHGSGKYYAEILTGGSSYPGSSFAPAVGFFRWSAGIGGIGGTEFLHLGGDGTIYFTGTSIGITGLGTMAAGQVLMFAYDADTGRMWMGRNGTWFNSGNPGAGTGQVRTVTAGMPYTFGACCNATSSATFTLRGKASEFTYPLPSGFSEWGGAAVGTSLMLHGDGPDGSASVVDSSRFARAITANGGAVIRTLQSKFGGGALSIPGGASDSFTMAQGPSGELDLVHKDGTFEVWLFLLAGSAIQRYAFTSGGVNSGLSITVTAANRLIVQAFGGAGLGLFPSAPTGFDLGVLPLSTWTHLSIDKVGYEWFIFLNGALVASSSSSTYLSVGLHANLPTVGNQSVNRWIGYIEELRITKGYSRHTVFIGAAWPTSAPADPNFANVTLLLPADSSFTDFSSYAHTRSGDVGTPVIDSAQAKYGAGSMLFNGANNIAYANSADWAFGAGDFTLELDLFPTVGVNGTAYDICAYTAGFSAANMSFHLYWVGGGAAVFRLSDGSTIFTANGIAGALCVNQWSHIAAVRFGNVLTLYVDGANGVAVTFTGTVCHPGAATLTIGGAPTVQFPTRYTGHIDNLRITKGTARYTASFARNYAGVAFAVDTLPFCDVLAGVTPVTPAPITATGATQLLLTTSGTASVGPTPIPSVDFVNFTPAAYEDAGTMTVQVTVAAAYAISPCSVTWATSNGSALAGTDYTASGGTASFTNAARTFNLVIPLLNNAVYAAGASKTFTITLSAPVGCTIATSSVVARIIDNDPAPGVALTANTLAYLTVDFNSDGRLDSSGLYVSGQWYTAGSTPGIGASFELRATLTNGPAIPGATGAWVSLAAGVTLGPSADTTGLGSIVFVEIRDAATGVVLASASQIFGSSVLV